MISVSLKPLAGNGAGGYSPNYYYQEAKKALRTATQQNAIPEPLSLFYEKQLDFFARVSDQVRDVGAEWNHVAGRQGWYA